MLLCVLVCVCVCVWMLFVTRCPKRKATDGDRTRDPLVKSQMLYH